MPLLADTDQQVKTSDEGRTGERDGANRVHACIIWIHLYRHRSAIREGY
jgi:hypothetical protein